MENLITGLAFVQNISGDITHLFESPYGLGSMASARLQLLPAIRASRKLGINVQMISLHSKKPKDFFHIKPSKACIVGKMSANETSSIQEMVVANLAAITRLKNNNSKIIVQSCDNHFATNDIISEFYKDIYLLADHIIFPSSQLLYLCRQYAKVDATQLHVVSDPWQIRKAYPVKELLDSEAIKIIWFGSNKNIVYLCQILPSLLQSMPKDYKYEITILGQKRAHDHILHLYSQIKDRFPNWVFRHVLCDYRKHPSQLEEELSRAHISLIPSDPKDPLKSGVSHNRLVDSLRAGCITIASPMESYKELSKIAILGSNFADLLWYAISNYKNCTKLLIKHRETSLNQFSPEINEKNWEILMKKILFSR